MTTDNLYRETIQARLDMVKSLYESCETARIGLEQEVFPLFERYLAFSQAHRTLEPCKAQNYILDRNDPFTGFSLSFTHDCAEHDPHLEYDENLQCVFLPFEYLFNPDSWEHEFLLRHNANRKQKDEEEKDGEERSRKQRYALWLELNEEFGTM